MKIQFSNVSISYDKKSNILNNVNLELVNGELIGFIGKSGCGKSTLLKSLFDYNTVLKGEILINDSNILNLSKHEQKKYKNIISYVDPDGLNVVELDTYKNILLDFNNYKNPFFKMFRILSKEQLNDLWNLADNFGVSEFLLTPVKLLSSGQKQRLNLVHGFFRKNKIILADEPTSNLDILNGKKVMRFFENNKTDKMILIAIHDIDLAMQYCDKLIAISDNKIDHIFEKNTYNKEVLVKYFDEKQI
ncbi:ATP-binding cassette domain-containing protein [Mycoplasma sp. Pen4]|uniref:ATP-binding cassette domain-containing protein n=1 Tax=Mycoplasma sp. Pen4 TaxID=640330 RepID=UPI001654356E|nr:ATP-binding cassette domain-containing protein [Mycoplasma sp. Pen4]QNM93590.1 ATP-binding cassette domain-containing protein [Mycoplasma sp. Pen4]